MGGSVGPRTRRAASPARRFLPFLRRLRDGSASSPEPRFRLPRAAVRMAAGGLLLASAAGVAAPASADVLVSNLGQSSDEEVIVSYDHGNVLWGVGQEFDTGSNQDGYRLDSVTIDVTMGESRDVPRIRIMEWVDGSAVSVHAFQVDAGATSTVGEKTFDAAEGVVLSPGTKYILMIDGYGKDFEATVNDVGGLRIRSTNATAEDVVNPATGWTIEDERSNWIPNGIGRNSDALKIKVEGAPLSAATGAPAISGTAWVGETLTAAKGTIDDVDGTTKADNGDAGYAYTYQWFRTEADGTNPADIAGATDGTYTLVDVDEGKKVKVEVSFKDDAGNAEGPLASDAYPSAGTVTRAGICRRTQQVRDAIVALVSGVSDCALVTDAHLAAITSTLNLENQGISALAVGDFDGLTALTTLDLRENSLTTLPAGVLDGLTALMRLDLLDNSLTTLPAGVFDGLTALTTLDLRKNSLTTLPAGVFGGLTALTHLFLSSTSPTTLPAGVFGGLTALMWLDLQGNALTTLPAGVFDGLTALTTLLLGNNSLTTLPAGVFDELTALTDLRLSLNALTTLPAGVFDELTALTTLFLNGNSLTTLPDDVFEKLTSLTTLWLPENPGVPFAPTAVALPDDGEISPAGGVLTLDGSGSGGPWGTNVTYAWALTSPTSGVTVTFDDAASATPVVTIPALVGGTKLAFTLTVTGHAAGNGAAPDTDIATVTVGSADATLSGLALTDGRGNAVPLSPAFVPGTTEYTAEVVHVDVVTIAPTANHVGARVQILPADSDGDSANGHQRALAAGANEVTIVVIAENATMQDYTLTINRTLPVLAVPSINVGIREDDGAATVKMELDPPIPADSALTVTVDYATKDSTAKQGLDYEAASGTLTFAAGDAARTFEVVILDDEIYGSDVRFGIDFTNPVGASLSTPAMQFIIDSEDPKPVATIESVTVDEGAGVATLTMTIDRESVFDAGYSGDRNFLRGTATLGDDYEFAAGFVLFAVPAGSTSATFDITIVDEAVAEGDETIEVHWFDAEEFPVSPETIVATIAITDNDPPAPVTGVAVTPGNTELTVGWNAADHAGGYKVQWKSGTETFADAATDDREAVIAGGATTSHTITGLAGGTEYTVRVIATRTLTGGTAVESAPSAEATGNIVSADATLRALTLSNPADGSAIALNATFVPATLTYTAGVGNAVEQLTIVPATNDDGATLEFLDGGGTALTDADTNEDDFQVVLAVGLNTIRVKVTAADTTTVRTYELKVTRAAALATDATLNALSLTDGDGNAIALSPAFDAATATYAANVGRGVAMATIAATAADAAATVAIVPADADGNAGNGHQVALTAGANDVTVTVTAEDTTTTQAYTVTVTRALPQLSFDPVSYSVNETDGAVVLTVTLEPAAGETVTVAWTTEDFSAEAGKNYVADSGTLSFAAGQTEQSITVDLVDNTTYLAVGNARFRVVLSAPVGALRGERAALGVGGRGARRGHAHPDSGGAGADGIGAD